jgi:hypothetical protein
MPGPIKDYWVPWQNLKVDKQVLQRLVAHAVGPAERDVDITRYDFVIIVLAATALQWGNQGLNTYPGLLGIADDSSLVTPGGRKIRGGIAIFAQSANLGKIFHNMAHIMAGVKGGRRVLPDMYDQDLASESTEKSGPLAIGALVRAQMHMGAWDPMSCNQAAAWLARREKAAHGKRRRKHRHQGRIAVRCSVIDARDPHSVDAAHLLSR